MGFSLGHSNSNNALISMVLDFFGTPCISSAKVVAVGKKKNMRDQSRSG